jgi:predicted secreted acid phosphatase
MSARRSLQRLLAATALIALLAAGARAADCPAVPQPHIPPMPVSPFNIDLVKKALRTYQKGDYAADLAAVYAAARGYVETRAGAVSNPAVVLDIDETSLSNWANIDADDFGFIPGGACDTLPKGPCGFNAWVALGAADAIKPALDLFNAAKAKKVAVLFVTARKESQRAVTEKNLHSAGYDGWAKLVLLPDGDTRSSQTYKTAARATLAKDYTIIANIGDQTSDLAGGSAECTFKLPNPFYFIE